MDVIKFGEMMDMAMKRKLISARGLSEALDGQISPSTISLIRRGLTAKPSFDYIGVICHALGMDIRKVWSKTTSFKFGSLE